MELFHKIMELVDKNVEHIPEGDYLQLCDTIQQLRQRVVLYDTTLPSDLDTAAQLDREELHQLWRERSGDEEDRYPGLNAFLHELDAEWVATDNTGPVEPGAYYPPHDGTTVAEVVMMDID